MEDCVYGVINVTGGCIVLFITNNYAVQRFHVFT